MWFVALLVGCSATAPPSIREPALFTTQPNTQPLVPTNGTALPPTNRPPEGGESSGTLTQITSPTQPGTTTNTTPSTTWTTPTTGGTTTSPTLTLPTGSTGGSGSGTGWTTTGWSTSTSTSPPSSSTPSQACYPGSNGSYTTCFPVVSLSSPPADYIYPAPLNGSAQYSKPVQFLNLTSVNGSTYVAANFKLDELAQSYKGTYAIVQAHAVESLQEIRDDLGALSINSGYRSPGYNSGIPGSATYSRHTYGDGFDIDPVSATLDQVADSCDYFGAGYVGVYSTHIHCDWRDDPLDTAFYGGARAGWIGGLPQLSAQLFFEDGLFSTTSEGWDEGQPLREWEAYDSQGELIAIERGDWFEPPERAVSLSVLVGKEIDLWFDL